MGCTIDHLRRDLLVQVIQGFQDAKGTRHEAGVVGTIRTLDYHQPTSELTIAWEIDGKPERLVFDLRSRTGPGNGRMKQFFADLGDAPPPPGTRMRISWAPRDARPPTPVAKLIQRGEGRDGGVLRQVWALAANRRFQEAEAQLKELQHWSDPACAQTLTFAVEVHADDEDGAVFEWLREKATTLWYCWGSTATSGGEGAAMAPDINRAVNRFQQIEKLRAAR